MEKNIVTGQQIGLLGGPLYTVYKVLGAIKLAQDIDGSPVYWLETNDADFNEINHFEYLDRENSLKKLTWEKESQGFSVGSIEVDRSLISLLNSFFSDIRQTEFTPDLREMVFSSYKNGFSLGHASARLVQHLFKNFKLTVFDPFDKKFREFCRPILLQEAYRTPIGSQCNMFCIIDKKRIPVFKTNEGFQSRDGSAVDVKKYDLVPNVKTRNLCQDAFFKTHSYIAGPGEEKYISELDPFYDFYQIKKSRIVPRMSITLIEPRIKRIAIKYGFDLPAMLRSAYRHGFIKDLLSERSGFDIKQLKADALEETSRFTAKLADMGLDTVSLKKELIQRVKKLVGEKRSEIKTGQQKMITAVNEIYDNLYPFNNKQDRVFNIFYYMNLYGGTGFINWLYKQYNNKLEFLEIAND